MDKQIEETARSCHACQMTQRAPSQVLIPRWSGALESWHMLHVDFTEPVKGYTFPDHDVRLHQVAQISQVTHLTLGAVLLECAAFALCDV